MHLQGGPKQRSSQSLSRSAEHLLGIGHNVRHLSCHSVIVISKSLIDHFYAHYFIHSTNTSDQLSRNAESIEMSFELGSKGKENRVHVPITLCLMILASYVCGGGALFSIWEDWDYLDGSYFCFVTLSIGFLLLLLNRLIFTVLKRHYWIRRSRSRSIGCWQFGITGKVGHLQSLSTRRYGYLQKIS